MPRDGYKSLTLDESTIKKIDELGNKKGCKNRNETLRMLLRDHEIDKAIKGKEIVMQNSIDKTDDPMIIPSKSSISAEKSPKKETSKAYVGGVFDE